MEVKKGYKQTEVDVIPEDWEVKSLGELCVKVQDGNYGGDYPKANEFLSYGVPFLTSKAIGKDGFLKTDLIDFISENKHSELRKAHIECNDVLFTNRGASVGAIGFVDSRISGGNIGPQLTLLRASHDVISPAFLFQSMKSFTVQRQILSQDSGSAMNFFGIAATKKFKIPIPLNLKEQAAIANALSDADALIQSMEKLIAKKRAIKQGAMQELLKPKEGWVVKKLGEIGSFSKGAGIKKDESNSGELPCIRYGEIYTRHNDFIKEYSSFISVEVAKTARRIKKGELLFAGSGETKEDIGKCVAFIKDDEAYAGGDIVVLSPQNVDSLFLGYYLNIKEIVKQKASKAQGDAVVHISASHLKDIIINLPGLEEQTRIATNLADMDTEISALETKLTKYKQIKQGMMQNLLTGRIRLI